MVGGQAAFLIIDDTAQPKKGKHSVGVAPQYATTLGKNANCQTLVSITLARDEVPVMVADGAPQRIGSMGQQHLPGEEAWLIGEHRSTGERKYYPSNLPADTPLKHLAGAVKARWACEQAHQQLEGGTRARPLRGPILRRPAQARLDDDDRLRLPPEPSPASGKRGKKDPPGPPP